MAAAVLPQLESDFFVTDGGLETTLVFLRGIELPEFAAFPLLDEAEGRTALEAYYAPYLDVATGAGRGFVLDTPTWRANKDWGQRLGYDAEAVADANRRAVAFVRGLAEARPDLETVLDGVIGPQGDGYVVENPMTQDGATAYHLLQTRAFAEAGADMVTAVTMTYADEAIGVVRAAGEAGLPAVISFTVEVDGRIPSGQELGEAIGQVDQETDGAAAYFMVNCAHPTHFLDVLGEGGAWTTRVKGVRANASRMSHAELDVAEELDRGDVGELAGLYARLGEVLPDLRVVGGCCGTDHEHVGAFVAALQTP